MTIAVDQLNTGQSVFCGYITDTLKQVFAMRTRSIKLRCLLLSLACMLVIIGLMKQKDSFYEYWIPHPEDVIIKGSFPLTTSLPGRTVVRRVAISKTVLIVAFHRTGSTLTGSTFQAYPGTFYVFEPFRMFDVSHGKSMTHFNGTSVFVTETNANDLMVRSLQDWITCKLYNLHVETFLEMHHTVFEDSLRPFKKCITERIAMHLQNDGFSNTMIEQLETSLRKTSTASDVVRFVLKQLASNDTKEELLHKVLQPCLAPLTNRCIRAPLRVFKFIRLRMRYLDPYLEKYSGLKVIHLIRDPRANIVSQKSVLKENAEFLALEYCTYLQDDMTSTKRFVKAYKSQVCLQYYEDFAEAPMETAKQLYNFVQLPWTKQVQDFVWQATLSGEQRNCSYCVQKGNSAATAQAWRARISASLNQLVTHICGRTMEMVGYIPLNNISDIRNLDIASRIKWK